MSSSTAPEKNTGRLPWMIRALSVVERVGNALPHPFWLFWILAGVLAVISAVLAGADTSVVSPKSGKEVHVQNLLSGEGVAMAMSTMVKNFASFPPMATIVVVIMGVAVSERTGFLSAVMRVSISRVPAGLVVFSVAFAGTVSHLASAAAYAILVPLGGMAFKAVGKSPILGIVVAYTSIASGYDASPIPTPNDTIFAGITTAAAHIVDENASVSPVSNWYFNIASSLLLALVITLVTTTVLAKRDDLEEDDAATGATTTLHLSRLETRGLILASGAVVLLLAVVIAAVIPSGSPLRGDGGSLADSPFLDGIAALVGFLFMVGGMVYGRVLGVIKAPKDIPPMMAEGVRQFAPTLVMFFAIAQFLQYFDWTHLGDVIAVGASQLLDQSNIPVTLIFLLVFALLSVVNVIITSGSAMWSIMAPVLVPMLMLLDVPADTTQAIFRIADSGSTSISPMSPYFVMALGFLQQYRKKAGIGTLAAYTLPLAICMTLAWVVLFFLWWWLGIPLGPGAPVK
jgi:aminobenzoyl-glutamate transport protein